MKRTELGAAAVSWSSMDVVLAVDTFFNASHEIKRHAAGWSFTIHRLLAIHPADITPNRISSISNPISASGHCVGDSLKPLKIQRVFGTEHCPRDYCLGLCGVDYRDDQGCHRLPQCVEQRRTTEYRSGHKKESTYFLSAVITAIRCALRGSSDDDAPHRRRTQSYSTYNPPLDEVEVNVILAADIEE